MATETEVTTMLEAAPAELAPQAHTEGLCDICHKPIAKGKEVDGLMVGATCFGHIGKVRLYAAGSMSAAPEGYLRMSKVCDAAESAGLTRSAIVTASGGDACANAAPIDPVFGVVYVGRGKWLSPDVLTLGFALLKGQVKVKKAAKTPDTTPTGWVPGAATIALLNGDGVKATAVQSALTKKAVKK